MKLIRNILLLVIGVFIINCVDREKEEKKVILSQIFSDKELEAARPEFLLEKNINLDSTPDQEKLFVIRNVKEEILAIFQKRENGLVLTHKTVFSMPHYGPFRYSMKSKSWEPYQIQNHANTYIINDMQFFRLPGDSFYSIFMEILSEEPPIPLFSVPFIFREGVRIFDGIEVLKEKKFLEENLKTDFIFDENSGRLNIMSPRGNIEMKLIFQEGKFKEVPNHLDK